jgi:uncharacterized membrane protein YcjF (UPF0283 family)
MKTRTSGSRIGLLQLLCYLTAIVMVIGSVVGGWNFNLLLALVMLVVLYAVLRDVRALTRLRSRNGVARPSRVVIPLQRSSRGGRPLRPTHRRSGQLGEVKKAQDSARWTRAPQQTRQKGTTHEIIG